MDSEQVVDDGLRNFLDVFEQTLETDEDIVKEKPKKIKRKIEKQTLKQDTSTTTSDGNDWLQQVVYLESNLITSKDSIIRVNGILERLLKEDMLTHSQF